MALVVTATEPVCWANAAEATRTRAAFKWVRVDPEWARTQSPDSIAAQGWRHRKKPGGDWYRVRVLSDTGKPLMEKIPQSAQYGTPLTGLQNANLKLFVKVLNKYGDEPNVRITQSAGHDVTGDNSYERYMLGIKGKGEGWIIAGSCPVVAAMNGDLHPHLVVSEGVRGAIDAAAGCHPNKLGVKNPPCPHYEAEQDARMERRQAEYDRLIANAKSEEAKLLEGQVKVQQDTAGALVDVVKAMSATVSGLAGQVADLQDKATAPAKPTKGDK
jgi:hypothetical protein